MKRELNYATVNQLTYEHLRDAIVHGELQPNQHIDPTALAAQLSVSRMPVREALHRLSESGFVVVLPHRGAFVAPLSREHLDEIYHIRMLLESYAARTATPHITAEMANELESIMDQVQDARREGDLASVTRLNRQFHESGYRASGLPLLCKMIGDLRTHSDRYRWLHARMPARSDQAHAEHAAILEAWRSRDPDTAERCVKENLQNTLLALLAAIDGAPGEDLNGSVAK